MRHLTIRNVDEDLATALQGERCRRGGSMNETVLNLLRRALGLETQHTYENGLRALAGTWTDEEFEEFEQATEAFGHIDEEQWT